MGSERDPVVLAKTELMSALGDNSFKYLSNMKMWFRQKWSKEEFDLECRKLLTADQMYLHNKFLIAILNKTDAIAPASQITGHGNNITNNSSSLTSSSSVHSKKRRKTTRPPSEWATFEPADITDYIPAEDLNETSNNSNLNEPQLRYAAQELFLPDTGLVMGRLLVGAWEYGLVNVDESASELVAQAVQILLKNILSAIILQKKATRYTSEGNYFYDVGQPLKHPFLRTTISKRKVDEEPVEINKVISSVNITPRLFEETIFTADCEQIYPVRRRRITTRDVYKTLLNKNVIPSHSVFTLNIERISNMLN